MPRPPVPSVPSVPFSPLARATLAALALAALAACSPTQYLISTREGGTIVTTGKPTLDDAAGVYTYVDPNGRTSTVRKEEVLVVTPR